VSVTALTRVRARPGGETALIAAAVRSFQALAPRRGDDAPPRLFQGYDDPERFYWLTQWADRELYLAGVPSGAADDWLNEVCEDDLERTFFTPVGRTDSERAANVAGGALVALDAEASRAGHALAEQRAAQLRTQPGVTQVALYRGLDDPGRYLVLCGWESEAARQRFYAEVLPRYEAAVREHGGNVETFVERTLTDVDRYPREPSATRPQIRAGRAPTD
jgi:heme-degrading monooxygenase HmoA